MSVTQPVTPQEELSHESSISPEGLAEGRVTPNINEDSVPETSKLNTTDVSSAADGEKEMPKTLFGDLAHSIKGFCMGVCDAVPGVSGGTVALIVGIYERLFTAITHIDRRLLGYLRKGEIKKAWVHMDARFLVALVIGMGMGYVAMSVAIKTLMASDTLRALTLASFCGMILGSVYLVFKMIKPQHKNAYLTCIGCGLLGCAVSSFIAFQSSAAATGEISLLYLFCCTIIAICAMILPGISGAMLLLIFGVYYYVVEIPRSLIHFENVGDNLTRLAVFLSGCVIGLLTFSRVIKWFLNNHKAPTLSTMLGLMIGSLVILWPFQNRIEPVIEHHKPTYEWFMPGEFNGTMVGVGFCIVFFAVAVIVADRFAAKTAADNG